MVIGYSILLSSVLLSAAVKSFAAAMISASRDAEGIRKLCGSHLVPVLCVLCLSV